MNREHLIARVASRRVEKLISGGWLAGLADYAAKAINAELFDEGWLPYEVGVSIVNNTLNYIISLETKDRIDPDVDHLSKVADRIAKKLRGFGYAKVEGKGVHLGSKPSAKIILTQRA